ncbi:MAG: PatB family C-S lyase [Clostridia bacterium]|nr:PatB family C-S lyase [Clostridia bacterium]
MNKLYRNDLDNPTSRYNTDSKKWDQLQSRFGYDNLLPAHIADMDFRTSPAIIDALCTKAEHGIYGYTDKDADCKAAEAAWLLRRYGFFCKSEWIVHCSGVVSGMLACIRSLTKTGERILVLPPVYAPFFSSVEQTGRRLIQVPLIEKEDGYFMDFTQIQSQFSKGVRMMLLCSPHNPVGRIWSKDELQRLIKLANRYRVIIVSDEIHSGFILDSDCTHTCLLSLPETDRCVMLTSPGKSFNLSGLHSASIIAKDPAIRKGVSRELFLSRCDTLNLFSSAALYAAYTKSDEWLDAVCAYICENRDFVCAYLQNHMPSISCHAPQGTYLMWLDFSALNRPHREIADFLLHDARVLLTDGWDFGTGGSLHFRLNIATSRSNIADILERIRSALEHKVWQNNVYPLQPEQSSLLKRIRSIAGKRIPQHSMLRRIWSLLKNQRSKLN